MRQKGSNEPGGEVYRVARNNQKEKAKACETRYHEDKTVVVMERSDGCFRLWETRQKTRQAAGQGSAAQRAAGASRAGEVSRVAERRSGVGDKREQKIVKHKKVRSQVQYCQAL